MVAQTNKDQEQTKRDIKFELWDTHFKLRTISSIFNKVLEETNEDVDTLINELYFIHNHIAALVDENIIKNYK